ncbi:type IX secretion system sortase PorU [uncultured Chitinophaga sp.]|uniref:type IX secretion system sortase PorU n=1 Tax=uncultured Chitinophaga sp. TaxID=339340 RepID=UPI0026361548|nr:type IX secretion system sortase PorU [uncultured Chitinophaga sp.]
MRPYFLWLLLLQGAWLPAAMGQRSYVPHSKLATGTWYKLGITQAGVYKITVAQLGSMGINTQALSSANIRIAGKGGAMLPEKNSGTYKDDLPETAVLVADGGDGLLNGDDYLLFYAPGPHAWEYQTASHTFTHRYNLYSDTAWYFLNVDQPGQRLTPDTPAASPSVTVNAFDHIAFYEKDSINLVSSGKQWWGPVFSNSPGATLTRNYTFTLPAAPSGPVQLKARAAARSTGSRFDITVNQQTAGSLQLSPVSGNIFEAFATSASGTFSVMVNSSQLEVGLQYNGNNGDQGWLDYLELHARCPLIIPGQASLQFRDAASVAPGTTALFMVNNTGPDTRVWDVTDAWKPVQLNVQRNGSQLQFARDASILREYVAFNPEQLPQPLYAGTVPNQDLHAIPPADMLIITIPALKAAADRLAAFHTAQDQLQVQVVMAHEIYNEFASGTPDPAAIRDFVKMCYDRAAGGGKRPRYLLLFGDASFDYKNRVPGNTNLVPTWESEASLDLINSYPSDDFFGFLDDADDITDINTRNLLDIAVGRLPVQTLDQAQQMVDKIIRYNTPAGFGPWRNHITFVADDGDNNLHVQDAEAVSAAAAASGPGMVADKIYLDAYPKIASAGGGRYPEVNSAIQRDMNSGNLVWNYTGHGSYSRLAEEVVVDAASIRGWTNVNKLPLMITATCDFAPFDNPAHNSLGEQILLQQRGGAIALMTTTRAVFAYSNRIMNANYLSQVFSPLQNGQMPTLGEAAMLGKNLTYTNYSDVANNRKFQLLGDPALRLAFPRYRVLTDSINGKDVNTVTDTLKALGQYVIKGHIADAQGNPVTGFNGILDIAVYDKPSVLRTRGNDAGSEAADYTLQQQVLFRGQQQVQNGQFSVTFVVPKDIDYRPGAGKISYYAANEQADAGGWFTGYQVGGTAESVRPDTTGPAIQAFLDTELFRNGGITGQDPVLLVKLSDSSGINTSGYGIGHDMVAILDTASKYFVLNDYYTASLNDFRSGSIRFPLYGLPEGPHELTIKAWDNYNNSSTATLRFVVIGSSTLAVQEVGNYPNPFTVETRFFFTHNQQGQQLDVVLEIFSSQGQLVKTIKETINASGNRYEGMQWNAMADSGARVPPGIYFYRITVSTKESKRVSGGKLIIF